MLRVIVFLCAFALLVFSLSSVFKYWDYAELEPNIADLMHKQIKAEDIAAQIQTAIRTDNPDDARMYLALAKTFAYPVDAAKFLPQIEALETPWQVTRRQATQFANGFLEGDGASTASVAGAVTADFTVVGDVRDLYEQYEAYQAGKDVNELITALAGIGVGLTAVTVASSGSAAPLKTGSSTLKLAARTKKLSPHLQTILVKQALDVFDYKKFLLATRGEKSLDSLKRAAVQAYNPQALDALGDTAKQVNAIRQSTSLVNTIDILSYADSLDDLRRLEKLSAKYGTETKAVLKLLGKSAIGTVRVLRHATELLIAGLASLISLLASILSIAAWFRSS